MKLKFLFMTESKGGDQFIPYTGTSENIKKILDFTRGKKVLFVGNRIAKAEKERDEAIKCIFGFSEVDDKILDDAKVKKHHNIVLFSSGFASHASYFPMKSDARSMGIPFIEVNKGRVVCCITAIAEFLGIKLTPIENVELQNRKPYKMEKKIEERIKGKNKISTKIDLANFENLLKLLMEKKITEDDFFNRLNENGITRRVYDFLQDKLTEVASSISINLRVCLEERFFEEASKEGQEKQSEFDSSRWQYSLNQEIYLGSFIWMEKLGVGQVIKEKTSTEPASIKIGSKKYDILSSSNLKVMKVDPTIEALQKWKKNATTSFKKGSYLYSDAIGYAEFISFDGSVIEVRDLEEASAASFEIQEIKDPIFALEPNELQIRENKNYKKLIHEIFDQESNRSIIKSFKLKNNLCSDFFEEDSHLMKNKIRDGLLEIVDNFTESCDFGFDIEDITLTGSLANYNWSKYSDVDLHIIVDYDNISEDKEIVKELLNAKKIVWNESHNIKIKGFDVEIYVQDAGEKHTSSGVYSVLNNEWAIKPKKTNPLIDKVKIMKKSNEYMKKVDRLIELSKKQNVFPQIDNLKSKIIKFRKSGLEKDGEYSYENLVFKVLRRNGYIEKLIDLKNELIDKSLSIKETEIVDNAKRPNGATMGTSYNDEAYRNFY